MADTFVRGFTTATFGASSDTIVLTKPEFVGDDDLLIMIVGNEDDEPWPTHTGWTLHDSGKGAFYPSLACYSRIADGTEGATETIDYTITGKGGGWYLHVRNYNAASPIYAYGATTGAFNSHSIAQDVFSILAGSIAIACFSCREGDDELEPYSSNGAIWPNSEPDDNYDELYDGTTGGDWSGAIMISDSYYLSGTDCYLDRDASGYFTSFQIGIYNGADGGTDPSAGGDRRIFNI